MKLSEMTNEELAKFLDQAAPYFEDRFLPEFNEIAARLRKIDWLNAKLKVAEDALDKIFKLVFVDCEVAMVAKNILAAISDEGGAK